MNERIDELMIQAGARFEFLHGVHYDDFQYRKFAELIVNRMIDNVECHADLYESPDIKFICEKIVNSIKFDFGVEE